MDSPAPPRPGTALVLLAYALGPAFGALLVLATLMALPDLRSPEGALPDLDALWGITWIATLLAYVIAGPAALAAGIAHLVARSLGRWRLALPIAAGGLVQVLSVAVALALITGGELSLAWRRLEEYVLFAWLPPLAIAMAALIGGALLALERRARADAPAETPHG